MERKEGYYWVKIPANEINPGWTIALWHDNDGGFEGGDWCWHAEALDTKHYDWFFEEINENRIPAPDEPGITAGKPVVIVSLWDRDENFGLFKPSEIVLDLSTTQHTPETVLELIKTAIGDISADKLNFTPTPILSAEHANEFYWGTPMIQADGSNIKPFQRYNTVTEHPPTKD